MIRFSVVIEAEFMTVRLSRVCNEFVACRDCSTSCKLLGRMKVANLFGSCTTILSSVPQRIFSAFIMCRKKKKKYVYYDFFTVMMITSLQWHAHRQLVTNVNEV